MRNLGGKKEKGQIKNGRLEGNLEKQGKNKKKKRGINSARFREKKGER